MRPINSTIMTCIIIYKCMDRCLNLLMLLYSMNGHKIVIYIETSKLWYIYRYGYLVIPTQKWYWFIQTNRRQYLKICVESLIDDYFVYNLMLLKYNVGVCNFLLLLVDGWL